jgi:hypothetical protein
MAPFVANTKRPRNIQTMAPTGRPGLCAAQGCRRRRHLRLSKAHEIRVQRRELWLGFGELLRAHNFPQSAAAVFGLPADLRVREGARSESDGSDTTLNLFKYAFLCLRLTLSHGLSHRAIVPIPPEVP